MHATEIIVCEMQIASRFQVRQFLFLRALANLVARHQLCFFVHRNENPLVAKLRRIFLADAPFLPAYICPNLIALHETASEVPHGSIHNRFGSLAFGHRAAFIVTQHPQ